MALSADIQQQVFDLLSRASTLSFVSTDQEAAGRLSLTPGQRVMAEVLTILPDSRAQVQVGTERFNLDVPMKVRTGQTLEMTFVSAEPRTTFAIARPGLAAPPVSLSDASRLLGLLVGNEQMGDPQLRGSLQSIGDLLRRSSGDGGILANLMDEALTYGDQATTVARGMTSQRQSGSGSSQGAVLQTAEQVRLKAFETNASQMLQQIARNSRFVLSEAASQPVTPLPLMPGQEVDAAVQGTLPGNRAFVQVAGATLELVLPRAVEPGDILRLTYLTSHPKPVFAVPRNPPAAAPGELSEAGRWLSVLEHAPGGVSEQQMYVLERLELVLKSLPSDSPAFSVIRDENVTYEAALRTPPPNPSGPQTPAAETAATSHPGLLQSGNGVMLSDEMARLLQALIKGDRLALLESLTQQNMAQSLAPGQQVKGEVVGTLGAGRFLIQVAGQDLEFMMPRGTQRGDRVTLFFVTDEPRPTFLLTRFGRGGDARLSDAGRWLSSFLSAAAGPLASRESFALMRALLSGPPADGAQVGPLLQQGLRQSGLFYESHLARWFGGDYPLEDILREPQGRLSHLKQPIVQENLPVDQVDQPTAKAGALEVMEAAFKKAALSEAHEGITEKKILPLVQEQLESLRAGQLLFRGELFPGQPLEWLVKERQARRQSGEGRQSWETALQIDMPKLGGVKGRLRLDGSGINVDIETARSDTAERLNGALVRLAEQLQAAGLVPGKMGVHHEPE